MHHCLVKRKVANKTDSLHWTALQRGQYTKELGVLEAKVLGIHRQVAVAEWLARLTACDATGPRFESHRGRLCLSRQPLRYTALGTSCAPLLQCLGRLSQWPNDGVAAASSDGGPTDGRGPDSSRVLGARTVALRLWTQPSTLRETVK